ncbi:nudix hydrolase 2-like [Zingiber officinale]|uniref:nudix hydrolase 2-like n=1 Tax=Zingiber officinale TaxID=94328 RepID=UPI001C4C13B0|nr:nudix hydrolase 2-like [Zingiber officinale]XP_042421304.1 nudix hydrolase 2-like [Zingiber officinale]XP_042421305.1 nudix hydrolase 2-like [Zingiber officinale]XP_042421306.1 nudix hydrolase 2-like [Zingiber officinale]XP_042421307.1 nudix hydrolase 2-like [Zingiber officinale]XP_042421308.1 nudix hydrolase 2-like [Zingiber officinale]XP_042421309.1 nudix hydrolase 2-like [Zingiber officinale]
MERCQQKKGEQQSTQERTMSISTSPSSVLTPKLHYDNDGDAALLTAVNDEHGGVIVEMKDPMNSTDFSISLKASLTNWKKQDGFLYHLAELTYSMLVRWLPNTQHTIPANSSHKFGIGAFVMNDNREWMPIEEYAEQPFVRYHELLKYILDVCLAKINGGYSGFSLVQISSTFFGQEREDCLFLNSRDFNH